jgi:polar amino acid transport system substrate-binding protein
MMRQSGPVRALVGVILAVALAGGCGGIPQSASPASPVPSPMPSTRVGSPSGTPAPVGGAECQKSTPAMSSMPSPGNMPRKTTMAKIFERGYLIAGVDQDSYAWGYPNPSPSPKDGEYYQGFDIDMVHALAYAIFGDANKVHFVPVGQDYRLGAAYQGIVDVVASSITINCARTRQVRFSVDYFDGGQRLLVPREDSTTDVSLDPSGVPHVTGLKGGKVCTVGSTTSADNLSALAKDGQFSIVVATNWSDCLVMLQQGDVQAFSTDNTILGGIAAEDPYLHLTGKSFSDEPHGLAFPLSDNPASSDNSQFVSFANGVIAGLESSTSGWCPQPRVSNNTSCWAAMYRRWVEPQLGPTPAHPSPEYSP